MPATSKQSLIVAGKPTRGRASPRAMRASELSTARVADAASLCTIALKAGSRRSMAARVKKKEIQRGKFPAKQRRVQIGGGIEQIRHG